MNFSTYAMIFAAGFVIMTPVGPVSTICIRRSLIYGQRAGIVAGAGNSVAAAAYATIGVTSGTVLPRFFAPFASAWHIGIAIILVVAAALIWRSQPTLAKSNGQFRESLISGFGATLALALANPADIVLFAALFAGLGIVVHTPLQDVLFYATMFTGSCVYWIALSFFLNRWRTGLTSKRIVWLNRTCSGLMVATAIASVVSLPHIIG